MYLPAGNLTLYSPFFNSSVPSHMLKSGQLLVFPSASTLKACSSASLNALPDCASVTDPDIEPISTLAKLKSILSVFWPATTVTKSASNSSYLLL